MRPCNATACLPSFEQRLRVQREFAAASLEGSLPWRRSRLSIVGQGRAGKTSFFRSLLGEAFDSAQQSTPGLHTSETAAVQDMGMQVSSVAATSEGVLMSWKETGADDDVGAALLGHAMSMLGHMYANGLSVEQSNETAIKWFTESWEGSSWPGAANGLGYLHMHGMGVEQDYEKALEWASKAAQQGQHGESC